MMPVNLQDGSLFHELRLQHSSTGWCKTQGISRTIATSHEGDGCSDIDDDIPIMAVSMSTQKILSKINGNITRQTKILTHERQLPSLDVFVSAQSTGANYDNIRPTVRIAGSSFNFDKNGLLVRYSKIDSSVQKVVLQ